MNQVLKSRVYAMGTDAQVDLVMRLGGFTEEEKKVLRLLHEGKGDLYIQDELGLSKTAYEPIEDRISRKVLLAIFDCINFRLTYENKL